MNEARAPAILLIDDNSGNLENLTNHVRQELNELEAHQVRAWDLRDVTDAPETAFENHVSADTVLVVTDLELSPARAGFLGDSVVAWCRQRFIPVGDFSRKPRTLYKESDLFELRVPQDETDDVLYITRMYRGFRDLRARMDGMETALDDAENPGQLLASLLERTELENQFSPYMTRPGMFNASLLDTLSDFDTHSAEHAAVEKKKLLTYILGHVFVNAVLRYPGPLLSGESCCAYLAMSMDDVDAVERTFRSAQFEGPFADGDKLYWRDKVDDEVEWLAIEHDVSDADFDSFGDFHRAVMEKTLSKSGRTAKRHACTRDECEGRKGGYWCPFTKRAVCEREDCSSPASSWVPSGAYACRVERVYFDERAPILGL